MRLGDLVIDFFGVYFYLPLILFIIFATHRLIAVSFFQNDLNISNWNISTRNTFRSIQVFVDVHDIYAYITNLRFSLFSLVRFYQNNEANLECPIAAAKPNLDVEKVSSITILGAMVLMLSVLPVPGSVVHPGVPVPAPDEDG